MITVWTPEVQAWIENKLEEHFKEHADDEWIMIEDVVYFGKTFDFTRLDNIDRLSDLVKNGDYSEN